jgi:hypothetical protein
VKSLLLDASESACLVLLPMTDPMPSILGVSRQLYLSHESWATNSADAALLTAAIGCRSIGVASGQVKTRRTPAAASFPVCAKQIRRSSIPKSSWARTARTQLP